MKTLSFWPLAWTLAVFTAVVFVLDVSLGLLFPNWWVMQHFGETILPGFTFVSWETFFVGLIESLAAGFLTVALFVPIYNNFISQMSQVTVPANVDVYK